VSSMYWYTAAARCGEPASPTVVGVVARPHLTRQLREEVRDEQSRMNGRPKTVHESGSTPLPQPHARAAPPHAAEFNHRRDAWGHTAPEGATSITPAQRAPLLDPRAGSRIGR
jgi:hypothetical protein